MNPPPNRSKKLPQSAPANAANKALGDWSWDVPKGEGFGKPLLLDSSFGSAEFLGETDCEGKHRDEAENGQVEYENIEWGSSAGRPFC